MDTNGFPRRAFPCGECPVRCDNASNPRSKFTAERRAALRATIDDGTGGSAPVDAPMFGCHKGAPGTDADLACAGWLARFGHRHVAVRLAVAFDRLPVETLIMPGPGWPDLYETWDAMVAAQTLRPGDPTDHLNPPLTGDIGGNAMNDPPTEERWLTGADVCALFEVSRSTLLRWEAVGKLPTVRTLGRHRRWRQFDVDAVRAERPLPTRDADGRVVADSVARPGQSAVDGLAVDGGDAA